MACARASIGLLLILTACSSPSATTGNRGSAASAPAEAAPPPGARDSDWTRFGWDAARSNASPASTRITARNVATLRRQSVRLEGTVDASAIYLAGVAIGKTTHDAFFVTTTYGKTMAIDADSGSVLWTYTPDGYSSWAGSARIVTATPVADPDRLYIYAASPDGHVQKLAVADGRVTWSTAITRLPSREKIAASLNYFDGRVIATTGGYIGDAPPYQGHVAVVDAGSGRIVNVWNALCADHSGLIEPRSCADSGSAIWGRAGAVVDPPTGNIFVATGNGRWDGRQSFGDAVVELTPDGSRLIGAYTPADTQQLDNRDLDLGSTSPALLGSDLALQGGKDGVLRLLKVAQLTGAHEGGELQTVATPSRVDLFTAPAVLHSGSSTTVFVIDGSGAAAWAVRDARLQETWHDGSGGTSPVLAGGLLFVYDARRALRVYDPASGRVVGTLACGAGHWNSPIVADGRIALPEGDANRHELTGVLDIWRLADQQPARPRR